MKKRARDLGIPFDGVCGKHNAITDVLGVEVGFCTILEGEPTENTPFNSDFARTGVTAILPRGKKRSAVFAGMFDFNGNGELTGSHWVEDSGFLHGPIMITNTNSVGIVREAASKWMVQNQFCFPIYKEGQTFEGTGFFYPTVGETYDGILNNVNGFNVTEEHAFAALNSAKSDALEEGNVGGGTGMRCHMFKGGTGTASRIISQETGQYTVGVLVQANQGTRESFEIRGIPMGLEIADCEPIINTFAAKPGDGSIIIVVATDAPVLPWQLKKIARRASLGMGKVGAGCENGSGDIFLAFSTANENAFTYTQTEITMLSDEQLDPIYKATVQATEEAILNALVAAKSMMGRDKNFIPALPHDQVIELLKKYGRHVSPKTEQ